MLKRTLTVAVLLAVGIGPSAPTHHAVAQERAPTNADWWPNQLDLGPLRLNSPGSSPLGDDFDYGEAFESVDLAALKAELAELMTTSQDWWPADFGHYGPFFIRMAWHSAGTYREMDGRGGADGGQQRFAPLNSWPDNANLDKAHRLLWPIKAKYGRAVSWADLIVLAGTVAMESMGFETLGFAGGREDDWAALEVNWGPEGEWLGADRRDGDGNLNPPLGATQMGLIYVNPQGPGGNPDPQAAADAIREAFGRMAMTDEETAALIAGGHTFGKAHGAAPAAGNVGVEPEGGAIEAQGFGWENTYGEGHGKDTITSGLEGAWTSSPARWTNNFLQNLYGFEWVQTTSPGGAIQWIPEGGAGANLVPDAHDGSLRHAPIMLTTDLALKVDPIYRDLTSRWLENPDEFEDAFARAWFKLTHRDLGPVSRYRGDLAPDQVFTWQDPVPAVDHTLIDAQDAQVLKADILGAGLSSAELVRAAWASASSFRATDMRGGANGARVRLAPQKDWAANDPQELARVIGVLEGVQRDFNGAQSGDKRVSLADLIVLGGAAGIELAAERGGVRVRVPFEPGRADASEAQTDIHAFNLLEPRADGFRNYLSSGNVRTPAEMLVEKASLLNLTIPEMSVLVGGMRALDANAGGAPHGVFTDRPGALSNDFFVNLIDMSTTWSESATPGVYEGRDRASGDLRWTATGVDLIFGSNSELRAVSEFYAADDAGEQFVHDFVAAWAKVMTLDRFDLDR
ncbi:MAG: catalase/peroxidase HPI [Acidobacteria bacterium]|nr:catalase/peroxidase HPI [Acidobacteriota bacterium]